MTDVPDWAGDAYKALAESLDKGVIELTANEKRQALYDDIKFWAEEARKSIEIDKKVLAAFVATFGDQGRVTPQAIAKNIVDGLCADGLSIVTYTGIIPALGHWPVDDEYAIKLIAKIIEQSVDAPSKE